MPPTPDEKWSGVEQRKYRRASLGVPIECRSGSVTISGKAENLSLGGILVRADQTFPWDEEVAVTFVLPTSAETFQARARVAHVVPDAFMGLEFLDLPLESRQLIEKYIAVVQIALG